jgi:hypothetical protein
LNDTGGRETAPIGPATAVVVEVEVELGAIAAAEEVEAEVTLEVGIDPESPHAAATTPRATNDSARPLTMGRQGRQGVVP